jgi:hypothetical protein
MEQLAATPACSLYRLQAHGTVASYIASTPATRRICNDPFIVGCEYTRALRNACGHILRELRNVNHLSPLVEQQSVVLHILRGGLNFGLREALANAYGWNRHSSAFISAQRARCSGNPEDWQITEGDYRKVYLPDPTTIIFGDVVATGTSLEYALRQLMLDVDAHSSQVRSLIFFTIGGSRAADILHAVDATCRERFPAYEGAVLVYLEGCFTVAQADSPLSIAVSGTDLMRRDSQLAPEFRESQYENPAYPLERCTIYDAGSRAFWLPEYLEDLRDYWQQTAALAANGMDFVSLLTERFPDLDHRRFGPVDLPALCDAQIAAANQPLDTP